MAWNQRPLPTLRRTMARNCFECMVLATLTNLPVWWLKYTCTHEHTVTQASRFTAQAGAGVSWKTRLGSEEEAVLVGELALSSDTAGKHQRTLSLAAVSVQLAEAALQVIHGGVTTSGFASRCPGR